VKLTPLDIRKQEFKKSMRGFDPEEVEAFLIMVADELEIVLREKNQQSDELIKLRTQLHDYQQVEHTLRETLMKATSTVEESRFNSLREAELRIHEAELQAERIIENAKEELQELRSEINLLRAQKESFSRRLRHLLESQIELLDVLGIDDAMIKQSSNTEEPQGPALRGRLPRPVLPAEKENPPAPGSEQPHAPVSAQAQTHGAAPTASGIAPAGAAPAAPAAPSSSFNIPPAGSSGPAEAETGSFFARSEGPRIIRGERRFDEPTGMQFSDESEQELPEKNGEEEQGRENNLSDQIVI